MSRACRRSPPLPPPKGVGVGAGSAKASSACATPARSPPLSSPEGGSGSGSGRGRRNPPAQARRPLRGPVRRRRNPSRAGGRGIASGERGLAQARLDSQHFASSTREQGVSLQRCYSHRRPEGKGSPCCAAIRIVDPRAMGLLAALQFASSTRGQGSPRCVIWSGAEAPGPRQ